GRSWPAAGGPAHLGGFGVSVPAVFHNLGCVLAGAPIEAQPRLPVAEALGSALGWAGLAFLYVWIHRRARHSPQAPILDLALLLPAAVLAGPLAWRYHLVALIPAQAAPATGAEPASAATALEIATR